MKYDDLSINQRFNKIERYCMKKYELTNITHPFNNKLRRIKALINIPRYGVKVGDLGGYIESEKNLSHDGDCWVFDSALVSGEARIFGSALVFGEAWVSGEARVYGEARVSGKALVSGEARVFGEAQVFGEARVSGEALIDYQVYSVYYIYNITVLKDRVFIGCSEFIFKDEKGLKHLLKTNKDNRVSKKDRLKIKRVIKALWSLYL